MFKIISFLLLVCIIVLSNNYIILSSLFLCVVVNYLILSNLRLKSLKKLRTPFITYTSIAIVNYVFNLQGLVINIAYIDIYIQSIITAFNIWLKLMSFSIAIFNIVLFQYKKLLVNNFTHLLSFIKILKLNPKALAEQIVLMFVFVEEISKSLNTKGENRNEISLKLHHLQNIKFNLIDKLIDKIKRALMECERYYENFKIENSTHKKNDKYIDQKSNIIDISFIILYTIHFGIQIYMKVYF